MLRWLKKEWGQFLSEKIASSGTSLLTEGPGVPVWSNCTNCRFKSPFLTCSSGIMVPLSGQDPPKAVRGEGSTIGFGLMKLLTSQEGVSDSALCMTTLSTMINLFQGNQSVLFSDMKGDLSKTRVTEMPPTATRSKLKKRKQIALFHFVLSSYYHNFQCITN